MPPVLRRTCTWPLIPGLLLLGACSFQAPHSPDDCGARFAAFQTATEPSHDAQYQRLAGFPGLRSDRLLAALAPPASDAVARRLWLQRLAQLDREASAIERGNLPLRQADRLPDEQALEACRQEQVVRLEHDPHAYARAGAAARVASDYRRWARTLGLYPLVRPIYRRAIAAWQAEAAAQQAPVGHARWLTFSPPAVPPPETSAALAHDALGLPQATAGQLDELFARHAPLLRIEQHSHADRPGAPHFAADGSHALYLQAPTVYRHHGWSRLSGRWHLQLVYQFWFSARPADGLLDIYAGELDGLLWRVTLDDAGNALLFDAIHPCGCWHALFLPADSPLQFRQPADQEQRLARRLTLAGSQAATLWLRAGDHALLWVDGRASPFPGSRYQLAALDDLRRLRHPDGRRSLYGSDGLVEGSQRLERWLLWPSGVVSPGAMRQWGRHATAFIGEAHFDDPDLLDRYILPMK